MSDHNHAISNARAWAASILEVMTALDALESGEAESVECDGCTYVDADSLRQHIDEMPLSVQVRGGWYTPGGEAPDAEEFEILLSTGGPALRIYGDIGGLARLQWQDWGAPWTDYFETSDDEDEAIASFVGSFWFGE